MADRAATPLNKAMARTRYLVVIMMYSGFKCSMRNSASPASMDDFSGHCNRPFGSDVRAPPHPTVQPERAIIMDANGMRMGREWGANGIPGAGNAMQIT